MEILKRADQTGNGFPRSRKYFFLQVFCWRDSREMLYNFFRLESSVKLTGSKAFLGEQNSILNDSTVKSAEPESDESEYSFVTYSIFDIVFAKTLQSLNA